MVSWCYIVFVRFRLGRTSQAEVSLSCLSFSYCFPFAFRGEQLAYATIRGSGHMAPHDQPEAMGALFYAFLNDPTRMTIGEIKPRRWIRKEGKGREVGEIALE